MVGEPFEGALAPSFFPVDLPASLLYNTYMTEQEEQDKVAQILRNGYCTGSHCAGKGIAEDEHTCHFDDEIHPGSLSHCNCCDKCAHECAMDI